MMTASLGKKPPRSDESTMQENSRENVSLKIPLIPATEVDKGSGEC